MYNALITYQCTAKHKTYFTNIIQLRDKTFKAVLHISHVRIQLGFFYQTVAKSVWSCPPRQDDLLTQ